MKVLHAFWDDVLGTSNSPEAALNAAAELPTAKAELAAISDEKTWIEESFEIARSEVYALQPNAQGYDVVLGDGYKSEARGGGIAFP
jgi:purine nucleoside phosphorylase